MSSTDDLITTLPQHQRDAINLIKVSLDCFNSRDGAGRFVGVTRYSVLSARAALCAVQAGGNVVRFWGLLLAKMQWPTPPKRADASIIAAIGCPDGGAVLAAIASEASSLVTLARALHDEDKQVRCDYHAALRDEEEASIAAADAARRSEPNDSLSDLGF